MNQMKDRLARVMAEKGLKQADLARKSGVSKPVISRVINNPERDLRATSLFAIADALQVDAEWLFRGRTSHSMAESVPAPTQRRPLPRLKRSQFYPRAFFH
ncbi:helix-turn-helix domain-containing protein [Aeromonas caviae]|uniref:helix-turn-helix domain-containing protein n=1 Tax=Aeromonas caviae TaxID=648 RepID=UPI0038D21E01